MYPLEERPASAGINAKRVSLWLAMFQNPSDKFSAPLGLLLQGGQRGTFRNVSS